MAIDNDDGSAYYDTHDNVFISASSGAAYGGSSLKSGKCPATTPPPPNHTHTSSTHPFPRTRCVDCDLSRSDFGGHDNYHHNNVDLFWDDGFGICSQLDYHSDGYYGNYLCMYSAGLLPATAHRPPADARAIPHPLPPQTWPRTATTAAASHARRRARPSSATTRSGARRAPSTSAA